jgi:hypothetical protein
MAWQRVPAAPVVIARTTGLRVKRRGRGRPGRGAEPIRVVAVRLTAEELAGVDAVAERENISRSEAIRKAVPGFAA